MNQPPLRAGMAVLAVATVALAPRPCGAGLPMPRAKWRAGTPISARRQRGSIGAEIDGQVLVYMADRIPENNAMGIFWKLDPPRKNEWSKLPSNSGAGCCNGASASIGRKFYVARRVFRLPEFPARVGWYPENKAWEFDLDSQKWSGAFRRCRRRAGAGSRRWPSARRSTSVAVPAFPAGARSFLTASPAVARSISMARSRSSIPRPKPGRRLAPIADPRRNHHSIAHVDGKLYAIGGRGRLMLFRAAGRRTCG